MSFISVFDVLGPNMMASPVSIPLGLLLLRIWHKK